MTVDLVPHNLHGVKGSLYSQYGQEETLQQPIILSMHIWTIQFCFKIDVNKCDTILKIHVILGPGAMVGIEYSDTCPCLQIFHSYYNWPDFNDFC